MVKTAQYASPIWHVQSSTITLFFFHPAIEDVMLLLCTVAYTKPLRATRGGLSAVSLTLQRAMGFSDTKLGRAHPYLSGFPTSLLISRPGAPHRSEKGVLTPVILHTLQITVCSLLRDTMQKRFHTADVYFGLIFPFFSSSYKILII